MENVEINITPMSLKNGVMGLPIQCCRNWDASGSVEGIFQYAGRKSSITFSPKHKNKESLLELHRFRNNSTQSLNASANEI